jgi:hypothetical protein
MRPSALTTDDGSTQATKPEHPNPREPPARPPRTLRSRRQGVLQRLRPLQPAVKACLFWYGDKWPPPSAPPEGLQFERAPRLRQVDVEALLVDAIGLSEMAECIDSQLAVFSVCAVQTFV